MMFFGHEPCVREKPLEETLAKTHLTLNSEPNLNCKSNPNRFLGLKIPKNFKQILDALVDPTWKILLSFTVLISSSGVYLSMKNGYCFDR